MKKSHTGTTAKSKQLTGILMGSFISMIITVLLSIGLTCLILKGSFTLQSADAASFIIRVLSIFFGSLLACFIVKKNMLQVIGLSSLGYLLILIAIAIIFFDGSFQHFASGFLSVLIGGICAFFVKMMQSGTGKRKKVYHR